MRNFILVAFAAITLAGAVTPASALTIVRDHRDPPVVRDHRNQTIVRDHRNQPDLRDHRH
ncbi:hypothetical protein ML401_31410 [Bradyrhizobium sp. 62B]|nr:MULTISPECIES: hypothetical protein [Bradyrhizobium]MBR0928970.1 hypothetical protein [Bradyrhizobium diazoefficiens]MDT4737104.1 hypothetical protein [Bradyrhizobium sp. WYCCWR 12699]WIW45906.1 hypothetical protein ML401_31410 [Bradyrhizobium sp. 62B]